MPPVRICAGGDQRWSSLPRPHFCENLSIQQALYYYAPPSPRRLPWSCPSHYSARQQPPASLLLRRRSPLLPGPPEPPRHAFRRTRHRLLPHDQSRPSCGCSRTRRLLRARLAARSFGVRARPQPGRWPQRTPLAESLFLLSPRFIAPHGRLALHRLQSGPRGALLASLGLAWSSARTHSVESTTDLLLDPHWADYCSPWDFREWRETLLAGGQEDEAEAVRQSTRTGAPLGSLEFVRQLEASTGRRLEVFARARPKGKSSGPEDEAAQECLFAGHEE